MKKTLLGAAAPTLAILLALSANAEAQTHRSTSARSSAATATAAPAVSASPLTHGPAIAGMCIYSNSRVIEDSAVGKSFQARLQQLRSQAAAELSAEQTSLQNDAKALQGKTPTEAQLAPLRQREQALQQKADLRQRELQATYVHQLQRLSAAIEPLVRNAYESHHCSILLNGDSVMAANPSMDVTTEVTSALNAKMSTITFDRETAPAQ